MDSFLLGITLGDSNVSLSKNQDKARFRISHTEKHKELVDVKYEKLKDYVATPPKLVENEGYGSYMWRFQTILDESFLYYYHLTWKNNRRVLPLDHLKQISTETMAWWIMDDGSGDRIQGISLYTYRYPPDQVQALRKSFMKQGLECRKDQKALEKGHKISFTTETSRLIAKEVAPFFVDCVRYKIDSLLVNYRSSTCIVCGDEIISPLALSGTFKYCDKEWCRRIKALCNANKWSLEKAVDVLNRRCVICGGPIPISSSATKKRCSKACINKKLPVISKL